MEAKGEKMKSINLSNGLSLPQLGFGTYKIIEESVLEEIIPEAYRLGYRLLDTASFYDNEKMIGDVLARHQLKDKISLCTKIWPKDYGRDETLRSVERSLENFGVDHLSTLFLHWPSEDFEKSWRALEELVDQGVCDNIAVCNFHQKHLEKLFLQGNIKPVIDQLESHPLLQQREMKEFLDRHDIRLQAWSPLARNRVELIEDELILNLSKKQGKSPQQIILRWHIQKGYMIIPKTVDSQRLEENISIFDFELDDSEIKRLEELDKGIRVSQNPDDEVWLHKIREK